MRVAIVGAGIAGLSAGRALTALGAAPTIFEKADRIGGRVTTRNLGGYRFDPGATGITPRGGPLEEVLQEIVDGDLIRIERPIHVHNGVRISAGDSAKNRIDRYTFASGNARFPLHLAQGLDIRLGAQVESITRENGKYRLREELFDAVILTPPIPQTSTLLWSLGESRPIANALYRPCLCVMLGFERPLENAPYHALLDPEQRHPLTWLSVESIKAPGRAPAGCCALVAQLSSWYSLAHFSYPTERIVDDTLDYIARLLGKGFDVPGVADVKRWKYSQPVSVALFDTVNPPGSKLIIAGDGVLAGRIENAYETGLRAARLLFPSA